MNEISLMNNMVALRAKPGGSFSEAEKILAVQELGVGQTVRKWG